MRPMIRCTVTRKGGSSTATTAAIATCRCISSVASTCCVPGCVRRTGMPRQAVSTSCNASWAGSQCASSANARGSGPRCIATRRYCLPRHPGPPDAAWHTTGARHRRYTAAGSNSSGSSRGRTALPGDRATDHRSHPGRARSRAAATARWTWTRPSPSPAMSSSTA